jgi:hypothetical protein
MVRFEADSVRVVTLSAEHNKALQRWEMIDDFCDGDREVLVSKYLTQHYTEKTGTRTATALWNGRKERTGYEDDANPYLVIHSGHLGREINFGKLSENEQFKKIIDDATGFGESAQELYQQKVETYLKYGLFAVLVDGPEVIADNKKEAQDNGERSYQVLFNGSQILHFSWFETGPRKGQVKEVVLKADPVMVGEELRDAAHYFYLPPEAQFNKALSFIKETLVAEAKDPNAKPGEKKYKVTETTTGTIPVIPIEIVGRGIRDSAMKGVVQQSWKIFNSISVCDSINHHQGFIWHYATGANENEVKEIHEAGVSLFANPDAKIDSVPAGVPTGYENQINREKATLKRIGMREFNQLADDTAQIQSADSKSLDQKSRLKWYQDITNKLERSERRTWQHIALYEGANAEEVAITIERDFGLDDPTATQSIRGMQFSRATQAGVEEIKDNLLKLDVLEMDIVPKADETVEDARARLFEAIDNRAPAEPVQIPGTSFGARRPSIAEKVNPPKEEEKPEEKKRPK